MRKLNLSSNRMLLNTNDLLENKLNAMINDLELLGEEMYNISITQVPRSINDNQIVPMAAAYSYSGSRGAKYANKYVINQNPYFYFITNGNGDCTNFVSQCIWAAYGGWSSTMTDAAMQSNISNKVRMNTSSWFAGSGGGASTSVLPIDISVGDVLQVGTSSNSYGHSVYVISTPGGSSPQYSEIIAAQHSGNRVRTVPEMVGSYSYMRQLYFVSASFDN